MQLPHVQGKSFCSGVGVARNVEAEGWSGISFTDIRSKKRSSIREYRDACHCVWHCRVSKSVHRGGRAEWTLSLSEGSLSPCTLTRVATVHNSAQVHLPRPI
jgi:hypothetical protein